MPQISDSAKNEEIGYSSPREEIKEEGQSNSNPNVLLNKNGNPLRRRRKRSLQENQILEQAFLDNQGEWDVMLIDSLAL